jgi:hypothetical protein
MFSNVNEAIQAFYLSDCKGFLLYIDWTKSLYTDIPGINAWTQFFVQPVMRPPLSQLGPPVQRQWGVRNNIIAPRLLHRPGLAPPRDRMLAKWVIDKHLVLQPSLTDAIKRTQSALFESKQILGLHLRGPGRNHGGVPTFIRQLRAKWPQLGTPPYKAYFDAVDRAFAQHPYDRIFLCTDAESVRERVVRRYGTARVVWYDASLTRHGEMHERPRTHDFSKRKLGEDVLIEAYLLSKVDFLVHGNSNVTNFVLCNAPTLRAEDIFQCCYSPPVS